MTINRKNIYSRIRIYAKRIYAKTGYMQRLFWLPLLYFALFCIRLYAKTGYMQKFRWLPSVCIYADSTVPSSRQSQHHRFSNGIGFLLFPSSFPSLVPVQERFGLVFMLDFAQFRFI